MQYLYQYQSTAISTSKENCAFRLLQAVKVKQRSKSRKTAENDKQIKENFYLWLALINPYPTAFPYGNGMVLHFYQQQESSTTKTVHKVINKGLKTYV